jgi:hypothetical protein
VLVLVAVLVCESYNIYYMYLKGTIFGNPTNSPKTAARRHRSRACVQKYASSVTLVVRVLYSEYLECGSCRPRRSSTYLPAPLRRAVRPASRSRRTVQNCSKCCQAIRHAVVCGQAIKGIYKKKYLLYKQGLYY